MKNFNVVSLSRKKIVYRYPKKEERRGWIATLASFVLVVLSALILRLSVSNDMFEVVGKVYNPTSPLYKEMTNIVFTDSGEVVTDLPIITVSSGAVLWDQ